MAASPTSRKARAVFEEAIECDSPEARAAFVEQACRGDETLLQRVLSLIRANDEADSLLPEDLVPFELSIPAGELPGDSIGRYRLLEKIGEGGGGIVYMAEQEAPVRRKVALKIVRPGMDSRQVIARFEAERQALAMMEHPNIAKVHDGGVTDMGRPYFVMELVRGVRITEHCQERQLSMRQRLDLFMAVCSAVQHAHQKGIIHRDLKPSNILVTEIDGKPVAKVIDFGIARATEQKLTDKTLFTQFSQFIGTPAYMSPEQAALSGTDVDTRSDIYSLGVLLYELLTGTTPFDAQELLQAGFDEMRRVIRETDPPKPSTRLTESRGATSHPSPDTRHSSLPSDLDWIVMKCLEKDRGRRYETASGLAADIGRHLNSEPVTARPASPAYRFRKMVRRNKFAFAAGGAVLAALVIGLSVSVWQSIEKSRALDRAQSAEKAQREQRRIAETEAEKSRQVAQFLQDMLGGVRPSVAMGRDAKMLQDILDKTADRIGKDLKDQPEVEAELRKVIGKVYGSLGEYEKAAAMLNAALAITKKLRGNEHEDMVYLLNALAQVLRDQGNLAGAEAAAREALAMDRKLGGEDGDVSTSLNSLGLVLDSRGLYSEAEKIHREALAMNRKFAGDKPKEAAISLNNLAVVLQAQQKFGEAETTLREALAIQKKQLGSGHPDVAITLNNLSNAVQAQNKFKESETLFLEIVPLQRKLLGNAHPNVATALNGLALALHKQGRSDEAEPLLREGVEIVKKARGTAHPQTATLVGNLGRIMEGQRKFDEAAALYREALTILSQLPGPEHPHMASWRNQLINLFNSREMWPKLETVMREDLASARRNASGDGLHLAVAESLIYLASALRKQRKFPEAETMLLECNGMLEQKPKVQTDVFQRIRGESLTGIVRLYEAWQKPDKASEWQQKLRAFENENAASDSEAKGK